MRSSRDPHERHHLSHPQITLTYHELRHVGSHQIITADSTDLLKGRIGLETKPRHGLQASSILPYYVASGAITRYKFLRPPCSCWSTRQDNEVLVDFGASRYCISHIIGDGGTDRCAVVCKRLKGR